MRTVGILCCGLLIGVGWAGLAQAQDEIEGIIQRTSTPPVIDGVGDDAVWQNANAHPTDEWYPLPDDVNVDDEADLSATWKALWDDDNLYVLVEVTDDVIINDVACDWQDDSVELYIDAQNLDVDSFETGVNPGIPAYQLTAIAGNSIDGFCGNVLYENTAFSHGINSYAEDDAVSQYPQGEDDSVAVITDENHYSFEVAFPWEALEETPDNILARGDMGFGVAINDADLGGARDTQLMWATELADLWQRSDSFPSVALSTETVGGEVNPQLWAGDADQDLDFDQLDLVKVQIAAKYLTGQPATWGEGDWNGAPGGEVGNPPAGNGTFDQLDIIAALGPGHYLTGPYAALAGPAPPGGENDEQTSIVYDPATGELGVNAPASTELTSINIDSASGIFTGAPAENLGGSFDNDSDDNIFKATFGSSFGSLSFGAVAQPGLSEDFVVNDLTAVGSLAGGGDLGPVDLIYIPEPSTLVLVGLAVVGMLFLRRRR